MELIAAKEVIICKNLVGSTTKSGIVVMDDEKSKPELGVVMVIGSGELPSIDLKIGDTVVFRKYTDNRIFIDGEELNFIKFEDILGVVRK